MIFQLTYYTIQKIIEEEKHLFQADETKEDDCRCEKCENIELLLISIKASLIKGKREDLASQLSIDPIEFISNMVCSVKKYKCCNDICKNCPGRNMAAEITEFLGGADDITYFKWV